MFVSSSTMSPLHKQICCNSWQHIKMARSGHCWALKLRCPWKAYNPDHLYVFVHMCIGNQSCLIYIYMYVYIHHTSSLIAHMHWSSICMVGLSHTHVQCFFVACPELMLMHCQLTPRMSTQCALHYTCTLCHMTDLYLLNCIYIISTT